MKITVMVPVYNGGEELGQCLTSLGHSRRQPDEIIVIDDGSSDGSGSLARQHGAIVCTVPDGPRGPANARNRGAELATGDVLVFIDSDVAVHPDTIERMENHFSLHPDVDALFGSYDDNPPGTGLATIYKNLLHHDTHQRSGRIASTFWAGCGAIRSVVFRSCGGFDERFARPSIEDIELGVRLVRQGYRVLSCPDVQATHLKRWTFANLLHTDIFSRAVPWTRLIIRDGTLPNDLNVGKSGRASAVAAWTMAMAFPLALWHPLAFPALIAAFGLFWIHNHGFLRLVRRRKGALFCLGAACLHLLYYLYSSLTFAVVAAHEFMFGPGRSVLPGRTEA